MTTPIDFQMFDSDHHCYEPPEAFTQHLDKKMRRRAVNFVDLNGRASLLVAEKVSRFVPNPTFDPISKPGALYDYFRGTTDGDVRAAFGDLEAIADHPEYRERDARLRVMDERGVAGCFLFPTLGVGLEEPLIGDPAPAPTARGNLLPSDPGFDRFWALAAEAGVTIGYHSGDSGQAYVTRHWGARCSPAG